MGVHCSRRPGGMSTIMSRLLNTASVVAVLPNANIHLGPLASSAVGLAAEENGHYHQDAGDLCLRADTAGYTSTLCSDATSPWLCSGDFDSDSLTIF